MKRMQPADRKAAEHRLGEIRLEIKALLDSTAPVGNRVAGWEALRTESLNLQMKLDAGEH